MLGIVTRYQKHDSTFAALAIARHLEARGCNFSLLSRGWRAKSVIPDWDSHIKTVRYDTWLKNKQLIIWTEPADEAWLHYAAVNHVYSYLYSSWEQFGSYDEKTLSYYARILAPTPMQAMLLRDRFQLANVSSIPFTPGLPVTHKRGNMVPGQLRLFTSLYGAQLKRVELAAVLMLADMCAEFPEVHVTIACSKGLAPYTIRDLREYAKQFGTRWTVKHDCPWQEQTLLIADSDLTVWPAKYDGIGLLGLTSLYMGTPVVAWDVPPMNEHLSPGANALLVPCELDYNWLGVPHAIPDYEEFVRVLRWIISKPAVLADLRKKTHDRLLEQRKAFAVGWDQILPA
jgi:glycosyltransferase involved in cell wall biosynthesis